MTVLTRRELVEIVTGGVAATVVAAMPPDKPHYLEATFPSEPWPPGSHPIFHDANQSNDPAALMREFHMEDNTVVITSNGQMVKFPVEGHHRGECFTIKNTDNFESITVMSDGETWHLI